MSPAMTERVDALAVAEIGWVRIAERDQEALAR